MQSVTPIRTPFRGLAQSAPVAPPVILAGDRLHLRFAGTDSADSASPRQKPLKPEQDGPGPVRRFFYKSRYWLLSLALLAGVGDVAYLQAQRAQDHERIQNLEAEIGASYKAIELDDGSVLVISSTGQITATTLGQTAQASGFIRSYTPGMVHWGSGVFIRDAKGDFYFMTNNHVVDGNSEDGTFDINPYRTGNWVETTVVTRSATPDLAILKVSDPDFVPPAFIDAGQIRNLQEEPLKEGEAVFAVGNPNQDRHRILPGIIHDFDGRLGVQYLAPCDHGASGGPIFDMKGRLIGIEQLVSNDPPGRCQGIDVETVQNWLDQNDIAMAVDAKQEDEA